MQEINNFLAHPPYRMVFMSIIALSIALFMIFFYTKLFPKKRMPYWLILLILSLPPLVNIFRQGIFESGDFHFHAIRTYYFSESLREGILIPRWIEGIKNNYGYAEFNYVYPLPYYFSSILYFLGISVINSTKIALSLVYLLSGQIMYFWLKENTQDKYAFGGAILYLFSPYHLIDLHFRSHLGEIFAFMIIPLTFLFLEKIIKSKTFTWVILFSFSVAALILSHAGIAVVTVIFNLLYAVFLLYSNRGKNMFKVLLGYIFGLLLTSYYAIPFFFEESLNNSLLSKTYLDFPEIKNLFISDWRLGFLFQGPQGEHATLIGYPHALLLLISILFIVNKKYKTGWRLKYFTFCTITLILLLTSFSRPIWDNAFFLRGMKIPYRILAVIAFMSSTSGVLIMRKFQSTVLLVLITIFAVLSTILNWGNRGMLSEIDDNILIQYVPNADLIYTGDIDTIMDNIPNNKIEGVDDKIEIIYSNTGTNFREYVIKTTNKVKVQENTNYYPGWELYINGELSDIGFDTDELPNPMRFTVDKGIHSIKFLFSDTLLIYYSNLISLITLTMCGIILIVEGKRGLR